MTDDSRPIPDPTKLTTEQLLRELGQLEKFMNARVDALEQVLQLQIDAAREAVAVQASGADRAVAKAEVSTGKSIENLQMILRTGFDSIDTQIGDLKGRLIRVEESRSVGQTGYTNTLSTIMLVVAVTAVLISVGSLFFSLKQ